MCMALLNHHAMESGLEDILAAIEAVGGGDRTDASKEGFSKAVKTFVCGKEGEGGENG